MGRWIIERRINFYRNDSSTPLVIDFARNDERCELLNPDELVIAVEKISIRFTYPLSVKEDLHVRIYLDVFMKDIRKSMMKKNKM